MNVCLAAHGGRIAKFLRHRLFQRLCHKDRAGPGHPSWYEHAETFEILRKRGAAHVSVSSLRMPTNLNVTSDFIYVRFHGLEHGAAHDYSREELQPWADHCRRCLDNGISVFAYFNNDLNTRAPGNAETFREMITRKKKGGAVQRRLVEMKRC